MCIRDSTSTPPSHSTPTPPDNKPTSHDYAGTPARTTVFARAPGKPDQLAAAKAEATACAVLPSPACLAHQAATA
eukprot:1474074-Alexandrium_andersonii.AAC.1